MENINIRLQFINFFFKVCSMKNVLSSVFYFTLSSVLTWMFVVLCPLYVSKEQMLLSSFIAGGKWGIQIILALVFLKEDAFLFLRKIGFVCLLGSLILLPFILSAYFQFANGGEFFFGSLIVAVVMMILAYYHSVIAMELSLKWWYFWLLALAIAISLQLTVVFNFI